MLRLRELDSFLGVATSIVAAKEELAFLILPLFSTNIILLFDSLCKSRILINVLWLCEWDKFLYKATIIVAATVESPPSAYSSN